MLYLDMWLEYWREYVRIYVYFSKIKILLIGHFLATQFSNYD